MTYETFCLHNPDHGPRYARFLFGGHFQLCRRFTVEVVAPPPQTEFHGSSEEATELEEAVNRNCGCDYDANDGHRTKTCQAHLMLLNDQRALDGLLWMKHSAEALKEKEGTR